MRRSVQLLLALAVLAIPTVVHGQQPLPLKFTGPATSAAITPADLMKRLYEFADDSMGGRQAGSEFNLKGTAYIARSLEALGVRPAGENGTYFQDVPFVAARLDRASTITVGERVLKAGEDFVAYAADNARELSGARVIFGGALADTTNLLDAAQVRGNVVVLGPLAMAIANPQAFVASEGYRRYQAVMSEAGAIVTVRGAQLTPNDIRNALEPPPGNVHVFDADAQPTPLTIIATTATAEALLGGPVAAATKGAAGAPAHFAIRHTQERRPGRNVIGVIPGSDARLKNEYVVIGSHNDHVGFNNIAQDHDSLRAFNTVARPGGVEDPRREPSAEEWARIRALTDSLHALHGGARKDSIFNGADDDGSGSMAMLEIAEAFAKSGQKPKRSLLFVWHTGEELGMNGSHYFTEHPTVPREQMVGTLNIDMIGRGAADDVENGGPQYLQLLGSRRLSTEYGDLVEQVNKDTNAGFVFDYQYDANGHPQQFYCRSDHWEYGRLGIPVTFFSTGGHRDYHMRTDEPQYIDYPKYARVTQFIHDVAARVANLDHRLVVDQPKPDPDAPCVQ